MKSLFGVFKSQKQEGKKFHDGIIVEGDEKSSHYEYKPAAVETTKPVVNVDAHNENEKDQNEIDLQNFVDKAQAYLNSGSKALAEAEDKTHQLEAMDPESIDYNELVEEVRSLQAKAGYDFKQAQTLIKTANSLKEQETANA